MLLWLFVKEACGFSMKVDKYYNQNAPKSEPKQVEHHEQADLVL